MENNSQGKRFLWRFIQSCMPHVLLLQQITHKQFLYYWIDSINLPGLNKYLILIKPNDFLCFWDGAADQLFFSTILDLKAKFWEAGMNSVQRWVNMEKNVSSLSRDSKRGKLVIQTVLLPRWLN